ncbi:MAG: citrate/2-methylcitrate synthase [Desulfobacterales bacterium]|jgi:citrate synthase|nr:citrate/2-methylcitrate synthase [Desulfobacterales bacterium]
MIKNQLESIKSLILKAAEEAREETAHEPEPESPKKQKWPIKCTVGPGLEGAIACESKVGYVNGAKGWLVYRGYNIFDLCAYSTYEETAYLLIHGKMPSMTELKEFKADLFNYTRINDVLRQLMGFPIERMSVMGALRLGSNLLRSQYSDFDLVVARPSSADAIGADEDSIAMETSPIGENHAVFEFKMPTRRKTDQGNRGFNKMSGIESSYHLIAGISCIAAATSRIHNNKLPLEPQPGLSHAGNLIYMITGREPTPIEERVLDISLILHADHGLNASTFATMVVASTLADIYFSVGAGIAALSGPLHGGANEEVMRNLRQIGDASNVTGWLEKKLAQKNKVSGFGHRVYKAYDPRARILGPLAGVLIEGKPELKALYGIAKTLESTVLNTLGKTKKIFPNVDFYSGLVYSALGFDDELFTPMFAASRVAGWTARVLEYMANNRIFRPRGLCLGDFNKTYVPIEAR